MKRTILVSLFSGFLGSALLLILLSATGIVSARSAAVIRSDVARANEVQAVATLTSTFSYQGQLINDGSPVNQTCDFQFRLHDALSGGSPIGSLQTVSSVNVSRGLFTALLNTGNEFGDTAFNGEARWLSIAVRCPTGGAFTQLNPRQPLTSLPFALPGLRTFPNAASPNIIGGYSGNFISPNVDGGVIGGGGAVGDVNSVQADYATVGGGINNSASANYATVGGGVNNSASSTNATVGGGYNNSASSTNATVAGGGSNSASGVYATVGGGYSNSASGNSNTVVGGFDNSASGVYATVSGGVGNSASGISAAVGGGHSNSAAGDYSFAAGRRAKLASTADGAFMFADSNNFNFNSNTLNAFSVRTTGGVKFVVGINGSGDPTWTCSVANGGSWSCSSDRNLKENLSAIDGRATLDRLSRVPILNWNAIGTDPKVTHLGPMAQDFYAAFGLGDDDKLISTIDLDGVALASIQELYRMVQEKDAQLTAQQTQIDKLQNQTAPSTAFNLFNLLSVIAFAGFAVMWLQQHRSKRGQA